RRRPRRPRAPRTRGRRHGDAGVTARRRAARVGETVPRTALRRDARRVDLLRNREGGTPMPVQTTYPGVYIEELPSGVHTIVGVSTSVTAFVGAAPTGPVGTPVRITSAAQYARIFGGPLDADRPMGHAVTHFFANG